MKKYLFLLIIPAVFGTAATIHAQSWSAAGLSYPNIVYTLTDYNGALQAGGAFSSPNEIRAMCVYDGDLYSGGHNGGATTAIYKNGVSIGTTSGANNLVYAMAVYNNQLYVAGSFTGINGVAANNIAGWNGSVWSAAGSGAGAPGEIINAVCVYNGALYAGGTQSGECYQWDGASWSVAGNFSDNTGWGYIRCMGVYSGELYVGGTFDTVNGSGAVNLAKFNGGSWSSAGDIGVAGVGDGVSAIAEYNGQLYCGGHFTEAGGNAANYIAYGDGWNWQALGNGTDGVVLALHVFNQSLYVAGYFSHAGGITVSNIAKWAPPCTPPVATISYSGAPVLCNPGGTLLLSANTGTGLTYQWKNGNSQISGATSSSYLVTLLGIYSVVVTNASGCSKESDDIGISASWVTAYISPSGSVSLCSGSSAVLTAYTSAGYTYQWKNNGVIIPGATLSTYNATTTGAYTVDETAGVCTKTSNTVTVTVHQLPSATITPTGPTTFCSGGSVVLNVPTGANKTYQWKKGTNLISGATLSSYTTAIGGNYRVIVTNTATGCSKTTANATTVTVNALPNAAITPQGPTTFCAGGNVVLQANTGTGLTYQWKKGGNNISGATSSNYTASIGGIYKVKVTNGNACSKLSSGITVTVPCKSGESESVPVAAGIDVKVFPNPSPGEFTIQFSNKPAAPVQIEIIDEMGRVVKKFETDDATVMIKDLNLANGIYSLVARNSDEVVVKKINIVK